MALRTALRRLSLSEMSSEPRYFQIVARPKLLDAGTLNTAHDAIRMRASEIVWKQLGASQETVPPNLDFRLTVDGEALITGVIGIPSTIPSREFHDRIVAALAAFVASELDAHYARVRTLWRGQTIVPAAERTFDA